ncbi:MAG: TetR/AcrR family transcriptional regulator [Pseudomonadales bacterium]|nr:TetR/AcrR family transcriptional regulator [Pseudomonadales bacterium]
MAEKTIKSVARKTVKPEKARGRPKGSNAEHVILSGAWKAFAVHGYHDCSVANILEYSGSSRTNFYRFFKNKEEVFESILKSNIEVLDKFLSIAFKEAKKTTDIREKFEIINQCYINTCFAAGDILPVLFQEQHTLPEHKVMREKLFNKIQKGIEAMIKDAGQEVPDPLLIQALMAGVDRIILQLSMKRISVDSKKAKASELISQFYDPICEHLLS